jgi:hypothetical protein
VTNDASVLAGTIIAQGVSDAGDRLALWLQGTQAIAAVATTIGVLIALYVAVVREPRKAAEEGRRHKAQMDALRRAVEKRVAAHARKVVPSCARSPILGDSWWTVRIDNTSKAATTILAVDVAAIGANGIEVPDGCKQASNTLSVDQAFERSTLAALSGSIEGRFHQSPSGEEIFTGISQQRSSRLRPAFRQALRDAVVGHFATEWPCTVPPSQHTVMAYTIAKPNYTLRVTIEYEDEAGYQWRRTDTGQPKRIRK